MRRAAFLALPALAALGAVAVAAPKPAAKPAAAAAAPVAAGPRHIGEFYVRCQQTRSVAPCDMYEERANKDTGQRVVGFSLGYAPAAGRYIVQIAVPLGIDIDKGVVISDGKLSTPAMPYRRCDQAGCYVEAAIDKSLLELFGKMGSDAKIKVVAFNGEDAGKNFSFTFSFNGFNEALSDMVAENKTKAASPETATDAR
jgi:invasion protein IalB